jgi:hypothetical protein
MRMISWADAPSTNRGVIFDGTPSEPFFFYDWFQGTIKAEWEEVEPRIFRALEGMSFDLLSSQIADQNVFVQRGWGYGIDFVQDGRVFLNLSIGGTNGKHGVFFKTTGHSSPEVARRLQNEFITPDSSILTVSRMDIALDVRGSFSSVSQLAQDLARSLGLSVICYGDFYDPDPEDGRTIYLKESNTTKLRIYEKGKEQRGKGIDGDAPLDWLRIELEVRSPKGKHNKLFKQIMAGQKPENVFKSFQSYVSILNAIGSEIEYKKISRSSLAIPSTFDQKRKNMARQYDRVLKDSLETPESFQALLSDLYQTYNDVPDWLQKYLLYNGAYA